MQNFEQYKMISHDKNQTWVVLQLSNCMGCKLGTNAKFIYIVKKKGFKLSKIHNLFLY